MPSLNIGVSLERIKFHLATAGEQAGLPQLEMISAGYDFTGDFKIYLQCEKHGKRHTWPVMLSSGNENEIISDLAQGIRDFAASFKPPWNTRWPEGAEL